MFLYVHSVTGSIYKPTRKLGLIIKENGTYEINLSFKTRICYLNRYCFEKSLAEGNNAFYKLVAGGINAPIEF